MGRSSAMKLHPETDRRAAKLSSTGKHQPREPMPCDLFDCDHNVTDIIMRFVGIDAYLSVASVSTRWRHAWGQRPRATSPKWAVQSCSCLDWARASNIDVSDDPCLLAAAEGRLDVLQHAMALGYSREGMAICEKAAAGGHLEVVKWCRANGYPWGLTKLRAAEGGHLKVLQWCIESNAPDVAKGSLGLGPFRGPIQLIPGISETEVWDSAIEGGHLETVIWCFQQGYRWDDETCYLAAEGGHLELLKWLRNKGCPWSRHTMLGAARVGDVEMLEWCRANGCPWDERVFDVATSQGNLEMVKWSIANDPYPDIDPYTCYTAAMNGHLEIVQYLRGVGFDWGYDVCYSAACGGHFEVLKWCIANECPWDDVLGDELMLEFNGTIPMMVWAIANGCPWMTDPSSVNRLCLSAARGGNLEVLKWCATSHRIASPEAFRIAACYGHAHVLEWLRANTGLFDAYTNAHLSTSAASSGSLETVKWCRANGYPWCQDTCTAAARSGNLELLKWCRANGCPWGDDTCEAVIIKGNFEMLAWCRDNCCPPDRRWRESSLWAGYVEMIDWCWDPSPSESSA